jgi:hypothetical protein
VSTTDRENREDPIPAQEIAMNREKAQRAREQFEREYDARVQAERQASGLCIMCGVVLSPLDRLLRARRHRRCHIFVD